MYWAEAAHKRSGASYIYPIAKELEENEATINSELIGTQGKPQEIGGYYQPNSELTSKAMRPSATFNAILAEIS
jgi:isocitrate dehydrogenase